MGRHAQGWKLEWRRGIGYVRFTHAKKQHLISTGERDPRKAGAEAARLYSRVVSGTVARPASTRALVLASLPVLLSEWLASLHGVLDPETVKTYEVTYVGKHWLAHFDSIEDMCSEVARERYRNARLKSAVAGTVKKECWAQDKFLRWCKAHKVIGSTPDRLEWDKRTLGVRTGRQRQKAQELTEEQVHAVIEALPEWFETGKRAKERIPYPVRDRFVFAYETSLRPATLDELRWSDLLPDGRLQIRDETDKTRFGRIVPLTLRATDALNRVRNGLSRRGQPWVGDALVFGRHAYHKALNKAAVAVGLKTVAPYDLRHARATHLTDRGGSLTGVGYLLGHKQASTTSRYLHGSERAAVETLSRSTAELDLGAPAPTSTQVPDIMGDRRVSNPRQLEPQGSRPVADSRTWHQVIAADVGGKPAETAPSQFPDLENALWSPRAFPFVASLLGGRGGA